MSAARTAAPSLTARRSCRRERNSDLYGLRLPILEPFCQDAQGKYLGLRGRLVRGHTIGQDARKLRDLRNPASVVLKLDLNAQVHERLCSTRRSSLHLGSLHSFAPGHFPFLSASSGAKWPRCCNQAINTSAGSAATAVAMKNRGQPIAATR